MPEDQLYRKISISSKYQGLKNVVHIIYDIIYILYITGIYIQKITVGCSYLALLSDYSDICYRIRSFDIKGLIKLYITYFKAPTMIRLSTPRKRKKIRANRRAKILKKEGKT